MPASAVPRQAIWLRRVAWAILVVGVVLRGVIWAQQRSLYLDEANLLRNFTERSYLGLFRNLDYEQYSPPLFSVLIKGCLGLFGNNELSVRLVPVLASMFTLGLFFRQTQRWLAPPVAVFVLSFLAFGKVFIDYGTVCKQYATDGLAALALIEVAYYVGRGRFGAREAAIWVLVGCTSIWFSMPTVFVLAGIGIWYLLEAWQRQQWRAVGWVLGTGLAWLLGFGVYYLLLLQTNVKSNYLQQYHHEMFLAFPPHNVEELQLLAKQVGELINKTVGKTALAAVLAILCFPLGLYQLLRRQRFLACVLLVPIAACLAASALHYYSLMSRLVLFMLPLLLLVLGYGAQWLARQHKGAAWGVAILGLVVLANQQQLRYLGQAFQSDYADVRSALEYVAQHQQPGDAVFAYYNVAPVARYYTQEHTPGLPLANLTLQEPGSLPTAQDPFANGLLMLQQQGVRRIWIVYDREDEGPAHLAAAQGNIVARYPVYRGYALLYESKATVPQ
ncbi:hypothetical protein HMJ29_03540 [Hymenobacter taeanensis]|uniref:Glycosyltransferase RgtA/B/C/D-like domain-containing protein n=1 Tax=Hymenobacter taeanensis TaxID=2735321 RepID=A0A6M6BDN0_9BACT|nr:MULTISPECIES: glycosyltransferase family 39 protein [Hymenobacter]QJX46060.1 hypothetical protein HMJ29_03540 [Hymenobacter taeanensis]UOQ79913.1 glycosyltransferase family 39 protein [Hymenobacter sp. 5414T-23]